LESHFNQHARNWKASIKALSTSKGTFDAISSGDLEVPGQQIRRGDEPGLLQVYIGSISFRDCLLYSAQQPFCMLRDWQLSVHGIAQWIQNAEPALMNIDPKKHERVIHFIQFDLA
jgi:hypothetical protein